MMAVSAPSALHGHLVEARRLMLAGDAVAAERAYRRCLLAQPTNGEALRAVGGLCVRRGLLAEGLACLQAATASLPGDADAWADRAMVELHMGRLQPGLDSLARALAIRPDQQDLRLHRARLMEEAERWDEALADYAAAAILAPEAFEAHAGAAHVLTVLGRPSEALGHCDAALAIEADDLEVLNNRANVLCLLSRPEAAIADYRRALVLAPGSAEVEANLGMALAMAGRFGEALAAYDAALEARPDLASIHANRALALLNLGRPQDALDTARHALAMAPDLLDAAIVEAKAVCELGRTEAAFDLFRGIARRRFGELARGAERLPGRATQAATLDAAGADWASADLKCLVLDDFLAPEALAELRAYCRQGLLWQADYPQGYKGAFPEAGFAAPLLAQIAEELRRHAPEVFADHTLRYAWAFRYQPEGQGTHVHADEAAINVNFWITPNEANLAPERGGLVVWDQGAPEDWDYARFNADRPAIEAYLSKVGARRRTIPYRANRAVIFDSNLFHATDEFRFAPGEDAARINITMLFGRRHETGGDDTRGASTHSEFEVV